MTHEGGTNILLLIIQSLLVHSSLAGVAAHQKSSPDHAEGPAVAKN